MPIRQFFYFDAIECLPENVFQSSNEQPTPVPDLPSKQTRYYSQELIFGENFQKKLGESKYFVVRKMTLLLLLFEQKIDLIFN